MEAIPRLGLGTWKAPDNNELVEMIKYAIEEVGYRHVDCAYLYQNEKHVGIALNDILKNGKVERKDLWITSKLWNTEHAPENVEKACRQTIADLQLDYLDLYLMHWPMSWKHGGNPFPYTDETKTQIEYENIPAIETWKAMEKLVEKGLVKRIGVSNFTIELLEKFLKSGQVTIKPYLNQVERNLFLQQDALVDYCNQKGIIVAGYRSIGGPKDSQNPENPVLLENPVLNEIANELGKTPAQIAIKFLLQADPHSVVLAKSINPDRIKSNFELEFELNETQMNRLKAENRGIRLCSTYPRWCVDVFCDHW